VPLIFTYGTLRDPAVIAASGTDRHRILRPGTDADDYVRVQVTLSSGRQARVYVSAD